MGFNSGFKGLTPPRSNGKPEAATAVYRLLMMGKRMPETCWAVFERRATNLRDWCIWLVVLFECMMMHGLTNPKCLSVRKGPTLQDEYKYPKCKRSYEPKRRQILCIKLNTCHSDNLLSNVKINFSSKTKYVLNVVRVNEKSNMPKMWCSLHWNGPDVYYFSSVKSRKT